MKIRKRPIIVVFVVFLSLLMLQAVRILTGPRYWLNLTASLPVGLYRMETRNKELHRGEMVVMKCPAGYEKYLYGRKWLPKGWPLFKTVGAQTGDTFCITDKTFSINGVNIGPVFSSDSSGLPLPVIRGCRTVGKGRFLPTANGLESSFDGRYFGAASESLVIGKVRPLLTFPQ